MVASCDVEDLPPEGQIVLHVMTDAPLPRTAESPTSDTTPCLFDRLSFEVFPPGASSPCAACVRTFEVDAAMVDAGRASVGVVPPAGAQGVLAPVRVRVRLFRAGLDAPAPRAASTIETVVLLPQTSDEGVLHLTVTLRAEDVGIAVGTLDRPVEAEPGAPARGIVGTWSGSKRSPCAGEPGPEELCIPGGPFWMGDPRLDLAGAADYQGANERLVVLAPFFLDRTEVTVAAFRASDLAERTSEGAVFNPQPAGPDSFCTYREASGPDEELPINCITWRLAQAYCARLGKRLPTEAELAYASSALGTTTYVWGEERPGCDDATFGRGSQHGECAATGMGPQPVGSARWDRLVLPTGTAFDLAGNVMEFAADFWQLDREPCWSGVGVLSDPLCDSPSSLDRVGRSLRGGSFSSPPTFLRAALRTSIQGESKAVSDEVGFRCASGRLTRPCQTQMLHETGSLRFRAPGSGPPPGRRAWPGPSGHVAQQPHQEHENDGSHLRPSTGHGS